MVIEVAEILKIDMSLLTCWPSVYSHALIDLLRKLNPLIKADYGCNLHHRLWVFLT